MNTTQWVTRGSRQGIETMIEKKIGVGDVCVDRGEVILSAYGIGSCVVIALYEPMRKIGGLSHVIVPFVSNESTRHPRGALSVMLTQMAEWNVQPDDVTAKIVGGASLFEEFHHDPIGRQNVLQTRQELCALRIPIIAEDVFGTWGRSIFFNLLTGEVLVQSLTHGNKIL